MWKRDETVTPRDAHRDLAAEAAAVDRRTAGKLELGKSVIIKGELSASEDLTLLDRHKARCPPMDGGYIFRTPEGTPIDPDNWYKRTFADIGTRAKLRATVGLHTLRHTYASLLIRQNESPKYVSRQLGHGSIQITMDTYGHLFKETSTQAMKRLNRMIPDRQPPKPARTTGHLRIVGGGR